MVVVEVQLQVSLEVKLEVELELEVEFHIERGLLLVLRLCATGGLLLSTRLRPTAAGSDLHPAVLEYVGSVTLAPMYNSALVSQAELL